MVKLSKKKLVMRHLAMEAFIYGIEKGYFGIEHGQDFHVSDDWVHTCKYYFSIAVEECTAEVRKLFNGDLRFEIVVRPEDEGHGSGSTLTFRMHRSPGRIEFSDPILHKRSGFDWVEILFVEHNIALPEYPLVWMHGF